MITSFHYGSSKRNDTLLITDSQWKQIKFVLCIVSVTKSSSQCIQINTCIKRQIVTNKLCLYVYCCWRSSYRVTQSLVLCVMFFSLCCLWFTDSDYPFGIFKLFLSRGEGWDLIKWFNTATFVPVQSQDLNFHAVVFLCSESSVNMIGDCSFCWYWWNRWPSLFLDFLNSQRSLENLLDIQIHLMNILKRKF